MGKSFSTHIVYDLGSQYPSARFEESSLGLRDSVVKSCFDFKMT